VLALAGGAQKFYWYDFENDGVSSTNVQDNFGLIHDQWAQNGAYTPKPAYVAYAALCRMLTGSRFVRIASLNLGSVIEVEFQKHADVVAVLWPTGGSQTVLLPAGHALTLTTLMGNTRTLKPRNGQVALTLNRDPVYLTGLTSPSTP
jgi:hypothetical protein